MQRRNSTKSNAFDCLAKRTLRTVTSWTMCLAKLFLSFNINVHVRMFFVNCEIGILSLTELYKAMLLERKFGLTTNVMATKMIPSLAPQTVNPALNVDQFTNLMEVHT